VTNDEEEEGENCLEKKTKFQNENSTVKIYTI